MSNQVKIKGIDIYHPEKIVENEYFINHFKEKGRDIKGFLAHMGKEKRFQIDNDSENSITMAKEASEKVLAKTGLSINDIDMIVFSTQVPQYSVPTNAMLLHEQLGGRNQTRVNDMNASCAGMVVAVEQTSLQMRANPKIKYALVVGSEQLSVLASPEEEISYAMFGDASCAVILEQSEDEVGFIDAEYYTISANTDKMLFPLEGMSNVLQGRGEGRYLRFLPFDASFGGPITEQMVKDLLERNQMSIDDIDAFCLSQFAYGDSTRLRDQFDLDMNKIVYVGNKYGYTGTTSPFLSMYEGIEQGRIKKGDTILFWTVGAGHQFIAMLFKY